METVTTEPTIQSTQTLSNNPKEDELDKEVVRVAIVQIETHPDITVGSTDYLAEPFISDSKEGPLLSQLLRIGDGHGVNELQDEIRKMYLEWAELRLRGILRWLSKENENLHTKEAPDMIVFSEFAVPFEHLHILQEHAKRYGCIIVAGNHSFRHRDSDYENEIGVKPEASLPNEDIEDGANSISVVIKPVNPKISGNEPREPEIKLRYKRKFSPFEFTEFHTEQRIPVHFNKWIEDEERQETFNFPKEFSADILICAEALQNVPLSKGAQFQIVCAYHTKPSDFYRSLEQTEKMGGVGLLASEGTFGGSAVKFNHDQRTDSWWLNEPFGGKLPEGSGIVLYQIPIQLLAAGAGVTNPFKRHKLIRLTNIHSEDKSEEAFRVSSSITQVIREALEEQPAHQAERSNQTTLIGPAGAGGSTSEEESKAKKRISLKEQEGLAKLSAEGQKRLALNIRHVLRRRKPTKIQAQKYYYLADLAYRGQLSRGAIRALVEDCTFSQLPKSRKNSA